MVPDSYYRCQANSAHTKESRPDYGLGYQVNVFQPFEVVPDSVGSRPVAAVVDDEVGLVQDARLGVRANTAHIRQSQPDSGLGFDVQVINTFEVFPIRSEAGLARI